ncbi:hypothetical protein [Zeimonas arvi]|uniref:Uncharacterized protein n=1 Tax=Zeimonas arvi TaxID=2498847 RepID=A0A5C8NQN6_9BURK|nr:hypothetical protein [Zeimonas arvi]TXL63558.1 hypothetical protein FHP08_17130 [Zeimonas arvi]
MPSLLTAKSPTTVDEMLDEDLAYLVRVKPVLYDLANAELARRTAEAPVIVQPSAAVVTIDGVSVRNTVPIFRVLAQIAHDGWMAPEKSVPQQQVLTDLRRAREAISDACTRLADAISVEWGGTGRWRVRSAVPVWFVGPVIHPKTGEGIWPRGEV